MPNQACHSMGRQRHWAEILPTQLSRQDSSMPQIMSSVSSIMCNFNMPPHSMRLCKLGSCWSCRAQMLHMTLLWQATALNQGPLDEACCACSHV